MIDLSEFNYDQLINISHYLNIPIVKQVHFKDEDHINHMLSTMNNTDEGFVAVDYSGDRFKRIKLKNKKYLDIARLMNGFSYKTILSIIIDDNVDEFIKIFPEYEKDFIYVKSGINNLIKQVSETFDNIKSYKSRKDFAIEAMKYDYKCFLFQVLDDVDHNVERVIKSSRIENLLIFVEKYCNK